MVDDFKQFLMHCEVTSFGSIYDYDTIYARKVYGRFGFYFCNRSFHKEQRQPMIHRLPLMRDKT